jgi:plasmid maintenance system antidote protein VapI
MKNKNQKQQKSLKRRMNRTAILSFYNARAFNGDVDRLAEATGYSKSHISNVIAGRRSVSTTLADAMYDISRRRTKNSEYWAAH